MISTNRRYDIDWLRVITIGLLLIYHIAIVFQPWGVLIGFIQSDKSMESLWKPMTLINIWRIPLLFFVSGMGVCFAIRKRSWKQLIAERTRRILVPFLFGILFIVPIHVFIWQYYYRQEITYAPGEGHLWFLKNIFVYTILLSPIFFYFIKNQHNTFVKWVRGMFKNPLGFLIVLIIFILEALLIDPDIYEMYAFTWHGFFLGLIAFLFGFIFILSGNTFWPSILKWRWHFLTLALIFYAVRFFIFDLKTPNYALSAESTMWIFSVFGFAYKHLNRPGKVLQYLSQGAYPIYILHMIFIYLGCALILPLDIAVYYKVILLIIFTFTGVFALYEIIRRVQFLRPLFGLKKQALDKTCMSPGINILTK